MSNVLFSKKLDDSNIKKRDYLLQKFSKYLNIENCDLLEIGCGNGRFAAILGPNFKSYTGVEPNKEYLRIAKETNTLAKAKYFEGKAEDVPLNEKFDAILYAFSWHFIKDFDKAISEAKRLLKKNGIMVIYEPSNKSKKWADSKLDVGSKDFDEKMYKNKLSDLEKGRNAISKLNKNGLSIVEEEIDNGENPNLWIIKF